MAERRDMFGRTEAQIEREIAHQKRGLMIAEFYSGNEGIALNKARRRASLTVDENCLKELRGEIVDREQPILYLSEAALEKWRANLIALAPAPGRYARSS